MKKIFTLFVISLSMFSITGCLGFKSPQEKIITTLELVVEKEAPFEKQQEPLVDLETQEQKIYEQILVASEDDHNKVTALAKEAITKVNKRRELMDIEQKSIKDAQSEFIKIYSIIKKIDDSKARKSANELYTIMMNRYEAHDTLYTSYKLGLDLDKQLYELMKSESPSIEQLERQIESINSAYRKILDANDKFNRLTQEFNQSKHNFYKQAGLTNIASK